MNIEEKYTPILLDELNFSFKLNNKLKKIAEEDLPNLLICGPKGSGKYTRIILTLKEHLKGVCNPLNAKPRPIDVETGKFTTFDKNKTIMSFISQSHCEIELLQKDAEKTIIPFIIYYSKTKNIHNNKHKYLILRNFEVLTEITQNALRTIVEKNQSKIRLLVTLSTYSKLINPLKSRFICLNLKSPTIAETTNIISIISSSENINVPKSTINRIIKKSYCGSFKVVNLKEVFLMLEGTFITNKLYISNRNEYSDTLIKLVKLGRRQNISKYIYDFYEKNEDIFIQIVFHDFYRKILSTVKDKFEFTKITAKWEAIISTDFVTGKLLITESYLFDVCHFLEFRR